MPKRTRPEVDQSEDVRPQKRSRPASEDFLSTLSDELKLRVFSYLSEPDLVVCERLSHKYQSLACDSQLWRSLYYDRFVEPRVRRVAGLRDSKHPKDNLHRPAKASRWLDEEHLLKRGRTNWKRQYKLRHNWSKGSCAVSEIPVADTTPVPPVLVQMHDGVVILVDKGDGLRAWSAGRRRMIAQLALTTLECSTPTALSIDTSTASRNLSHLVVGFENGSFRVFMLHRDQGKFSLIYSHEPSDGVITSTAIALPYLLTMTATQQMTLYNFGSTSAAAELQENMRSPSLIHSLKSHTVWPPLATSLRISNSTIYVCMAYALPTYLSGWTVGLQEVKVSSDGKIVDSRVASAVDEHYRPLAFTTRPVMHHITAMSSASSTASAAMELRHIHSKPTSLSYTHPYLLVSQPDNTLTLYLVTSTAESLSISPGSRLWGHTSAVSGAHVGGRGKAVSVSRRGDELRVWELEGGFSSIAAKKRLAGGDLSVQIRPEVVKDEPNAGMDLINQAISVRSHSLSCGLDDASRDYSELTLSRGWVAFDDENVVVLKERPQGTQALVVYDFT